VPDWNSEPFTSASRKHVAVWGKPVASAARSSKGRFEPEAADRIAEFLHLRRWCARRFEGIPEPEHKALIRRWRPGDPTRPWLQASFTTARERLESQWNGGDEGSTEDLRLALRQYRSFFDRLLAA
jgi:hypothetical protein